MANKFSVGLIQMRCNSDAESNASRAVERIEMAAHMGAEIVCLPELFRTPYFCKTHDINMFSLAETIPGPTTERLSSVAKKQNVVVIGSIFEKEMEGLFYNTAVVIDADGSFLGSYRKIHIPHDPHFYEKYYFRPGNLGYKVFRTQYASIGTLVCWDQWFPEAARLTALQGAEVIFYPTAIGWDTREKDMFGKSQFESWQTIQRAHAIANGVYVVAVNRVGIETCATGTLEFWGGSFVSDPFGSVLTHADSEKEEILVGVCNPERIQEVRRNWPFFRDRRTDTYQGLIN